MLSRSSDASPPITAGAGNGNVFCRGTATGLKRSVNPAGAGRASGVAPVKTPAIHSFAIAT